MNNNQEAIKAVYRNMYWAVREAVIDSVDITDGPVYRAVYWAIIRAVDEAVSWAAYDSVDREATS